MGNNFDDKVRHVMSLIADLEETAQQSADKATEKIEDVHRQIEEEIRQLSESWKETEESIKADESTFTDKQEYLRQGIERFVAEVKHQIVQFDTGLKSSMKDIADSYDDRQAELLEAFSNQLTDYKNELQYRFEKFENIGADIDVLEKNLRASMAESQRKIRASPEFHIGKYEFENV